MCYKFRVLSLSFKVRAAKGMGLKIRATGAAFSYSNLFPDEGNILMEMKDVKMLETGDSFTKHEVKLLVHEIGSRFRHLLTDFYILLQIRNIW